MRSVIMLINDYATFLSRLNEHTEAEALQREGLDIAVRFSAARRWLWRTCSTTSQ